MGVPQDLANARPVAVISRTWSSIVFCCHPCIEGHVPSNEIPHVGIFILRSYFGHGGDESMGHKIWNPGQHKPVTLAWSPWFGLWTRCLFDYFTVNRWNRLWELVSPLASSFLSHCRDVHAAQTRLIRKTVVLSQKPLLCWWFVTGRSYLAHNNIEFDKLESLFLISCTESVYKSGAREVLHRDIDHLYSVICNTSS